MPEDPELDLSWIPEKWRTMVIVQDKRSGATHIDRRYFKLCVFTQVAQELKSGDLFVVGCEQYGDFRNQLVSWETYRKEVTEYGRLVGLDTEPSGLVSALKAWLAAETAATDRAFPNNDVERLEVFEVGRTDFSGDAARWLGAYVTASLPARSEHGGGSD